MSIRHLRPRLQYSAEVASTNPDMNAPHVEKCILRARRNTITTPPIAARADINLAAYVFSPKSLKAIEAAQKYNGGFSRKGRPFNLGTTRSPDLAISAAIPATRGSSAFHRCRLPRPAKKSRQAKTSKVIKVGPVFLQLLLRIGMISL